MEKVHAQDIGLLHHTPGRHIDTRFHQEVALIIDAMIGAQSRVQEVEHESIDIKRLHTDHLHHIKAGIKVQLDTGTLILILTPLGIDIDHDQEKEKDHAIEKGKDHAIGKGKDHEIESGQDHGVGMRDLRTELTSQVPHLLDPKVENDQDQKTGSDQEQSPPRGTERLKRPTVVVEKEKNPHQKVLQRVIQRANHQKSPPHPNIKTPGMNQVAEINTVRRNQKHPRLHPVLKISTKNLQRV